MRRRFLLGRAVGHSGGADDVFFEHHRAHVVSAEAQAELTDFQSLRHPARLHVLEVREEQARDGEIFQVLDGSGFVPLAPAEGRVLRLEGPGDKRGEAACFFLQVVDRLQVVDAVLKFLADPEHHGRRCPLTKLVSGRVDVEPVFSETL